MSNKTGIADLMKKAASADASQLSPSRIFSSWDMVAPILVELTKNGLSAKQCLVWLTENGVNCNRTYVHLAINVIEALRRNGAVK